MGISFGSGKRNAQQLEATNHAGRNESRRLFYFMNSKNKLNFMVDTRAAIRVITVTKYPTTKISNLKRQAANGYSINVFSSKSFNLNIGISCDFTWSFSILGVEFLANSKLAFQMHTKHTLS